MEGGEAKGFRNGEEVVCDLLWGPIIKPLQLLLPPSLMPSIKYRYFEVCARHSPHVGKLSTNVVVPLFQVLHRTLLRIKTHGMNTKEHVEGTAGRLDTHKVHTSLP